MTREELRNKLTDILSAAMSGGINLTQAERSIWDLFNSGLPPAEGAIKVQWSGYGELGNISQKPLQPTAEGAEEILKNRLGEQFGLLTPFGLEILIAAMTDFATLHAQRLAEKMVEEKLKEELIAYDKWVGEKYIDNYRHETAPAIVDEYLKSREK